MVESIGSTNNLINMVSLSYQQDSFGAQKTGRPTATATATGQRNGCIITRPPWRIQHSGFRF